MNYINKQFNFAAIICLIILIMTSCRKFVELEPPRNSIASTEVFKDSTTATSAVLTVYLYLSAYPYDFATFNGAITAYAGLSADELVPNSLSANDIGLSYTNALIASQNLPNRTWYDSYEILYKINGCIEGLGNNDVLNASAKNQLLGESKFLRAFVYFHLVNLFGAVPLVTSTNFETNAVLPRSTVENIYGQITEDLRSAQELLRENYITQGRVRVNKYTASALLAKVYLYQKDFARAESMATQVIGNSVYSLESDLNKVFTANSKEAIWQLLPTEPGFNTAEGYAFVPESSTAIPAYAISIYLMNAFESSDARKTNGKWVKTNTTNGGQSYTFPFKYKLSYDGGSSPSEHYMVLRLADQYLIRAEARAQQNKLDEAKSDLNAIRNRAGLPNTTALTQTELLDAIFHERRIELFCEWGNRWFDLKRTGKVNQVMTIVTPAKGGVWNETKQLFPIPQSQLNTNPFLVQNPGY